MNTRKLHVLIAVCSIALLAPGLCGAQAQLFKVGPAGDYATIGDALVDLLASPLAVNLIKVQAGVTTLEHLSIPATWTTGTIWLSGGWDASFLNQSGNPTDTVISGWTGSSVISVTMAGGTLIISDLSIRDGVATSGAGLQIHPTSDSHIQLDNLEISNNLASFSGTVQGGGIEALLQDTSTLDIDGCDIHHNIAAGTNAGADVFGGGVYIRAEASSEFSIVDCLIHDNTTGSDLQVGGTGVALSLDNDSGGLVTDCVIEDNNASSTIQISVLGSGLRGGTSGSAQLVMERIRLFNNTVSIAGFHQQAVLSAGGDSIVTFSDSIIADGQYDGLYLSSSFQSTSYLTNLTVALNDNDGIRISRSATGTSEVYLSNSISANNGASDLNLSGSVTQTANIIGVDPEFVDPQDLDFRVEIGSVAEDAGVIAPYGGLGVADIRGGIRFLGAAPDAGAYEGNVSLIFSDGFDLNGADRWSDVVGG